VVSSGLPHTASSAPCRAANCCTKVFNRPSCSAVADCKSTKAKSTRCRTDWRIASSPVVHTIVAQCSSCAARTQSCARRAEVDTTRHVCNAAGARHLAGARASGDTRIAGKLVCKSLMKYGPSKKSFPPLRDHGHPIRRPTRSCKSIARITYLEPRAPCTRKRSSTDDRHAWLTRASRLCSQTVPASSASRCAH
jgi:hypothetical protein